jgi:agmatine/peptidylarginine deiminase
MIRRLPPEWTPQGAVMLIWPHESTDWGPRLDPIEDAYGALCTAITRHQALVVICRDRRVREHALARIAASGAPRAATATFVVDTDDTWARDIAPVTVLDDGLPVLVDTAFNGWGGRRAHERDAAFGRNLVDSAGFATLGYEASRLVLEPGAIETDGAGTVLVNRPSVAGDHRNPGWDEAAIEAELRRALGAERVLWLDVPPLPGDAVDGPVDTLARFCDEGTIAHAAPHGDDDPAAHALSALAEQLAALRTPGGEAYRLVPLPGPEPIQDDEGRTLPASYTGFLVLNGAVLVPSFADARDAAAIEALQPLFPDRIALPVPARTFLRRGGSLHRLTMNFPEGVFEDLALT